MKKTITAILIICLCLTATFCLFACGDEGSDTTETNQSDTSGAKVDVNIASMKNEQLAFEKTNDIWSYPKSYEGQTVKIKGKFSVGKLSGGGSDKHNFVGVYDGCCSWAYLTFKWDGDLPESGKTVTVVGTIHRASSNGVPYAEVDATSVTF